MTFGELISHIATTNYQFCASLKDTDPPALPAPLEKHNSPDGRLSGREVLLAMYIHVAHHRGQAEIYLRANRIRPPSYKI